MTIVAGALALVVLACLAAGLVFGVVARQVADRSHPARATAFDWGFALGPVGVVVVLLVRANERRRTRQNRSSPPLPFQVEP